MKDKKDRKVIRAAVKELDRIIIDLPEVAIVGEVPFQVKRIKKVRDDLAETNIHGSGTGRD